MEWIRFQEKPGIQETETRHTGDDLESKLVLFNDDIHTFDFVIDNLVKICGIDYPQAEQIATLVHFKGNATVKKGDHEELEVMCRKLVDKGLDAAVK